MRRDSFALLQHIAKHGVQRIFVPFVALNQLSEASPHLLLSWSLTFALI